MRISDWSSDVCSSDLFDALDGAERLRSAVGEWVIDTVDVGRDARIGIRKECIGTDATNVDDREVESLPVVHARCRLRKSLGIGNTLGLESIGTARSDRNLPDRTRAVSGKCVLSTL